MIEKNIDKNKNVKQQVVAGFIVYRRTPEGIKFLFLYRRGGYWNFPKGHFEYGENALATAFRETEEETGLKRADLHMISGFKTYVKFHFYHGDKKIYDTVILHLAEAKKAQVVISPREHSGFAWFLYSDAMKVLGEYRGTKRALSEAYDFLRGKGHPNRAAHTQRPNANLPRSGEASR